MERCALSTIFTLVTACACASAAADNLLANPGFDEVNERGLPRRWELFVMPMDGAFGRLDNVALDGSYSAMLYNPEAYAEEPANNWSQSIIADLGGKELLISGNIKCEDATEAAIWLQCWAKNRPRVLAAATTSTDSPVYGTRGWTHVEMKVTVPQRTDFIILRCVLKGRGTAWFDDLRVEDNSETDDSGDGEKTPAKTDAKTDAETDAKQKDEAKEHLLESGKEMGKAIAALRETNEALLAQIKALQGRFDALRRELMLDLPRPDPPAVPRPKKPLPETISPRGGAKVLAEPVRPRHPLVPHGYYTEQKAPK